MTPAIAVAVIAAFVVAFHASRILAITSEAWAITQSAMGTLRDPERDDAEREIAARQAAFSLFMATLQILLRGIVILLLALVPAILADLAGITPLGAVLVYLSRLDVILVGTVVILAGWLVGRRLWPKQ